VRKDADISNLEQREYREVTRVLDIFVKAQTSVHLLRATEPTLKLAIHLEKFLMDRTDETSPKCQHWNTDKDHKCLNLASRKQMAEAIVAVEERHHQKQQQQ